MMISTKGRYGLRIMLDIAAHRAEDAFVTVKDIAERQDISIKYLESIISVLSRHGLLESQRGKTGGYRLTRSPADYPVLDILRATEGSLAPVACLECEEPACSKSEHCQTLPLWKKLDHLIENYLQSVTLEDILQNRI